MRLCGRGNIHTRMRAVYVVLTTLALTLTGAAPAFASNAGEGWAGELNDKVITFFSLGVVIFFTVFVIVASWLQSVLDRRKEQRKAVELRRRVGW
jgi:uncharacterized BrkB/YihY/UPF0761 family membrane protein